MRRELTAAAVSLLVQGTAYSQQVTSTAAPTEGGLQEVFVTAERRQASVQTSSLSIAVLDGSSLAQAGVTEATDLGAVVPGLTVSLGGGTNQTYLRGVGSFATDAAAESSIAYNINGVYISRPSGVGPIFFDLERVEVLKGPQGTLYGRNATGGAINLITRRPTQEFSGDVSLDLGNYNLRRLTTALSGGITDGLSVRLAAQYNTHDGYLTDGYDDQDSVAARLTALWKPAEGTSLLLTGEYAHSTPQGEATVKRSALTANPSNPWEGPSVGMAQQPPTAFIPGGTAIQADGYNDLLLKAVSAELNVDLGFATLTFLPAYRDTQVSYLTYTPGFYFATAETSREQSYELRLGNDGRAVKWVAGLYYFNEDQTQLYHLRALPIQQSDVNTPLQTRSYAGFGQLTFSLTDTFRLIGGARYSDDRKRQGGQTNAVLPSPSTVNNFGSLEFSNVSWRAGAEYDLSAQNRLFLTAATGFKAGGFFPSVPFPNNNFGPEKLTAFTLGSRNRFLDRRLQLNLEGFYWQYKDKQERYLGATPSGTTGLLTANAGKATLYGASVDLLFKPTREDTVHVTTEYLHTVYDRFTYQAYNASVPGPVINSYAPEATGCAIGPVVPYTQNDFVPALRNDSTQQLDCSGKPLVRAPMWTGTVSYQRIFPLPGNATLQTGLDAQYSSSQYLSPDFISSGRSPGYVALDANLGLVTKDRWMLTLWGRNLTDRAIYTGGGRYAFSRGVAAGGDPTLFYANIRAPRTFGVSLAKDF